MWNLSYQGDGLLLENDSSLGTKCQEYVERADTAAAFSPKFSRNYQGLMEGVAVDVSWGFRYKIELLAWCTDA